jgi:hypothetical protein
MDVSEPMKESEPTNQEVIATQLIEYTHQLEKISLKGVVAACQACGTTFQEGDLVVVYAFRPAGAYKYQLGHVVCGNDQHDLPTEYTLGVPELLIEGQVGTCSNKAIHVAGATRTKCRRRERSGDVITVRCHDHTLPDTPRWCGRRSLMSGKSRVVRSNPWQHRPPHVKQHAKPMRIAADADRSQLPNEHQ